LTLVRMIAMTGIIGAFLIQKQ